MTCKHVFLAALITFMLASCGNNADRSEPEKTSSSAKASAAKTKSPIALEFRLKNAKHIDVDALLALMPEHSRPTYKSAEFDSQIGATVVSDLTFHDSAGDFLAIERAELYGVDLEAIDRIKTSEITDHNAPFETVFQKIRLFGVTPLNTANTAAHLSLTAAEIDVLRIRQGSFKHANDGNEAAQIFNAFELDGLYFQDINVTTEEEGAPEISFKAPDLRIVGLGGGKLEALIAHNPEYLVSQSEGSIDAMEERMGPQGAMFLQGPLRGLLAPTQQRTTFERLEWRSIDFSKLLSFALNGENPPVSIKNLISLGDLSVLDTKVFIDDNIAVHIAESTLSATEFMGFAPTKIEALTKDAIYDFTAYVPATEEDLLTVLRKHGLDNIKGNGKFEWIWDPKKGDAALSYVTEAKGLADFSLDFDLVGIEIDKIEAAIDADDEDAIASLAELDGFSLKIQDEKLLDAVFDIVGLQTGMGGSDLRLTTPAIIRLSGSKIAKLNSRFPGYIDAVADFITDGGSLQISTNTEAPVSILSITVAGNSMPLTLPDLLELEITHKE